MVAYGVEKLELGRLVVSWECLVRGDGRVESWLTGCAEKKMSLLEKIAPQIIAASFGED